MALQLFELNNSYQMPLYAILTKNQEGRIKIVEMKTEISRLKNEIATLVTQLNEYLK